jgi:hypothetical protein
MINQQLVQYIMQSMQQGYDYNTIRNYLLQSGWLQQDVDETLVYVYSQLNVSQEQGQTPQPIQVNMQNPQYKIPIHHTTTVHLSNQTIIVIGGSIVAISLVIIFMFTIFGGSGPGELLDNEIYLDKPKFYQGEKISFNNIIIDKGNKKKYDILARYEIKRNSDGKPMKTGEKTIAVEEKKTISYNIDTDSDWIEGMYTIEVDLIYGDNIFATAKESFEIYKKEEKSCTDNSDCTTNLCVDSICTEKIDNPENNTTVPKENPLNESGENDPETCDDDCDDENKCTDDSCNDGKCVHTQIFPCCGNSKCESEETKDTCPSDCSDKTIFKNEADLRLEVEKLVAQDSIEAAKFCQTLEQEKQKDHCFYLVADNSQKMEYCKYIKQDSKSDICYMRFISKTRDSSSCHYIKSNHLRTACESFGSSNTLLS